MEESNSMLGTDHFIMLDVLNTIRGNEFDGSYPYVQIDYPPNENSFHDNQAAESHPENGITHRERRKYLFTIQVNIDTHY